jgi:mono/diheme cytochrome c family protein
MAGSILLGIYDDIEPVVEALDCMRQLGVPENRVSVMSAYPIKGSVLGRHPDHGSLPIYTAVGAVLGAITALFLVGGTQILYPIRQGGQPLWPIPPQFIILFEVTMLGLMWATFIGWVLVNRLPNFGNPVNDERIPAGYIGLVVELQNGGGDRAESMLRDAGAVEVKRMPARKQVDLNKWWLWLFTVALILGVASLAGGLIAYDYLKIPWFSQMKNQPSIGYEQGPRLSAPAEAAPVQGPVLINDTTPGTMPVAVSPDSLQRGKVLYSMHCALCHGPTGEGNGPVGGFLVGNGGRQPANLTSPEIQSLTDNQIFIVITNGFGTMPTIREDLTVQERWDVVNWVRTFKK